MKLPIALAWTCMLLALACSTNTVQASGRLACGKFQTTADSLSNGLLSPIQFRDEITKLHEQGSAAEPAIKDASALLFATMTQGDGPGFRMGTADMFAACTDAGHYDMGN